MNGFLFAYGGESAGVRVCSVECGGGGVLATALGRRDPPGHALLTVPTWVEPEKARDVIKLSVHTRAGSYLGIKLH